jgi:hypothetical protein
MLFIVLNVAVVINDINTAGKTAKGNKPADQQKYFPGNKKIAGEKGWDEQKEVFCPVFRAQQLNVIFHCG